MPASLIKRKLSQKLFTVTSLTYVSLFRKSWGGSVPVTVKQATTLPLNNSAGPDEE